MFAGINLFQCARLLYGERPISLHPMEEELYVRMFVAKKVPLSRHDFKLLVSKALILDYDDSEVYLKSGAKIETLAAVISGTIDVLDQFLPQQHGDYARINVIRDWEWVDAVQFIFNMNLQDPHPAAVTLMANGPTQLCVWDLEDVRALCGASPQLSVCLLSVLSQDCANNILKTERYLMSFESVRKAARDATMSDTEYVRSRSNSLSMPPITPKERLLGIGDATIVEMPYIDYPRHSQSTSSSSDDDTSNRKVDKVSKGKGKSKSTKKDLAASAPVVSHTLRFPSSSTNTLTTGNHDNPPTEGAPDAGTGAITPRQILIRRPSRKLKELSTSAPTTPTAASTISSATLAPIGKAVAESTHSTSISPSSSTDRHAVPAILLPRPSHHQHVRHTAHSSNSSGNGDPFSSEEYQLEESRDSSSSLSKHPPISPNKRSKSARVERPGPTGDNSERSVEMTSLESQQSADRKSRKRERPPKLVSFEEKSSDDSSRPMASPSSPTTPSTPSALVVSDESREKSKKMKDEGKSVMETGPEEEVSQEQVEKKKHKKARKLPSSEDEVRAVENTGSPVVEDSDDESFQAKETSKRQKTRKHKQQSESPEDL